MKTADLEEARTLRRSSKFALAQALNKRVMSSITVHQRPEKAIDCVNRELAPQDASTHFNGLTQFFPNIFTLGAAFNQSQHTVEKKITQLILDCMVQGADFENSTKRCAIVVRW